MEQKPMEFKKGDAEQIVHTTLGSTTKPAEFLVGQFVKAKNLPGTWIVLQILGNHEYVIGSEGATQKINATDLTITEEE